MSSFCTAKATHIFSAKKIQHICVSLDLNFNESFTNDVISFEQLGPDIFFHISAQNIDCGYSLCYQDCILGVIMKLGGGWGV